MRYSSLYLLFILLIQNVLAQPQLCQGNYYTEEEGKNVLNAYSLTYSDQAG